MTTSTSCISESTGRCHCEKTIAALSTSPLSPVSAELEYGIQASTAADLGGLPGGASDEMMVAKPDLVYGAGRDGSEANQDHRPGLNTQGHGAAPIRVSPMAAGSTELHSRIRSARKWRSEVTSTPPGSEIARPHPASRPGAWSGPKCRADVQA